MALGMGAEAAREFLSCDGNRPSILRVGVVFGGFLKKKEKKFIFTLTYAKFSSIYAEPSDVSRANTRLSELNQISKK